MPQCSFKKCKNHTSRTLKKDGISYFRFPRDPVRCGEWISVIARQRSEEFFKPTQGSVVCSKHFLESDEYVTTKGIRRLHKTAVPRIVETNNHDVEDESSHKTAIEKCCLQPQDEPATGIEDDLGVESDEEIRELFETTEKHEMRLTIKRLQLVSSNRLKAICKLRGRIKRLIMKNRKLTDIIKQIIKK